MSELQDLYQQVILDHNRSPRNFRAIDDADHTAEGYNPLCGDRLTIWLKLDGGVIIDVAFKGSGCAISKASASLMTAALKGKTVEEAEKTFALFHSMVTGEAQKDFEPGDLRPLGIIQSGHVGGIRGNEMVGYEPARAEELEPPHADLRQQAALAGNRRGHDDVKGADSIGGDDEDPA